MANPSNLLYEYKYPLAIINKNANKDLDTRSKERIWYSQPRVDTNNTYEVLKISLRKPILITYLSFGVLNRPSTYEIWITSNGIRSQLLDSNLNVVFGKVLGDGTSPSNTWKNVNVDVNPIIISSIEIKLRRNTIEGTGKLVSLGIRDFLMKRSVKTQDDTLYSLSDEIDILGNPVRRVVQDWRPELATDNDAFTFWKSGPQPSPEAVVNFYATLGDGITPLRVDRIWIDPVYTGQNMNMYYSTDPTVGTITPKPKKADTDFINSSIILGRGIDLSAASKSYTINTTNLLSQNGTPLNLIGASGWIGGEFEIVSGLTGTVTIVRNPAAANFSLTLDTATKIFTFTNNWLGNTASKVDSSIISFSTGDRIQFVFAVSNNLETDEVTLRLIIGVSGVIVSDNQTTSSSHDTLAHLYDLASSLVFDSKIGYLRNLLIKVDVDSNLQYRSFIVDADSFLRPHIDASKQVNTFIKQSNLDGAILVGPYLTGEDAYGGLGEEFYTEKLWTPIWKDWTVQRGYYYLPYPIAASHLKLEFSKLTEQPYPIYETGIVVPYKTFPVSAIQDSSSVDTEVMPIAPGQSNIVPSINNNTINQLRYAPKTSIVFGSKVVGNIRNRTQYDFKSLVNEQVRNSSLKAAFASSPQDIASATLQYYFASLSGGVANSGGSDDMAASISTNVLNSSAISDNTKLNLGTRTPGWWYLPSGLKISASVMQEITQTSTQTERYSNTSDTSTLRTRFSTQSVHKYDVKYAKRDVGLAYFAGIRDFQAFSVDYTIPVDFAEYKTIDFSTDSASSTNMRLGTPGSVLGSYPLTTTLETSETLQTETDLETAGELIEGQVGQTIFKTWDSIGTFIKVAVTAIDRGLHSDTKGYDVEPLGLDNTGGFWDDPSTTWSDTVNVWGASSALVGLDFQSNLYFSGREAVKIYRSPGVGSAGIRTRIFDSVQGDRIRLCVSVYRPKTTSNTFILQLQDETPITGSVLYEETITVKPGRWQTIKTNYFVMPEEYDLLRVNFLIDGSEEETLYLSDLYDEETSIVYSISNDGGTNYYDATEIVNEPNKFLTLPSPGNHLKVKVDMYDSRDYAYGFTITPTYLY